MNIILLTTQDCHCSNIEQELLDIGVVYERCYAEDHPELVERFQIRHCPVLIVNNQRLIPIDGLQEGQISALLQQT